MLGWSREAWERVDPGSLLEELSREQRISPKRYRREAADIDPRRNFSSRFALVASARKRTRWLGKCQPRSGDTTQNQC
jgi:hypothetical protein